MVTGLRHFVHWRHPAVLTSEVCEWEQAQAYEVRAVLCSFVLSCV